MLKIKQSKRNEEIVKSAKNEQLILDTLKAPYYDYNGQLIGLIGISRDTLRERKKKKKSYISVITTI